MSTVAPHTVLDRYTVEALLGRGGMAVVYRARHNQLGTRHAIKVLMLPFASIQERMLQEGRVQAALRHPNIVNVSDVIDVQGAPGLVMELVDGPSLYDLLEREVLPLAAIDAIARGMIEGVAEAHRHGLIHRDLKPANVLLQVTPRGLVPKITDFGLAKVLGGGLEMGQTRTGSTMGTPEYMAPEQVRNAKAVDQRADVFSLGAILYELVTGDRPFRGDDLFEIFQAIATGSFTPVREAAPDAPERMLRAIEGALVVDPDRRLPDCEALLRLWTGADLGPVDPPPSWDPDLLERIGRIAPIHVPPPVDAPPPPSAAGTLPPDETTGALRPPPRPSRWVLPALFAVAGAALLVAAVAVLAAVVVWTSEPAPASAAAAVEAPSEPAVVRDTGSPAPAGDPPAEEAVPSAVPEAAPAVHEAPAVEVAPPAVAASRTGATPAADPSRRVVEPTTASAPAADAPVAETGRLVVNTSPWSESVTIDGKGVGRTPFRDAVPAGDRVVTMRASDGRVATATVHVPAGGSAVLCWDFELGAQCAR